MTLLIPALVLAADRHTPVVATAKDGTPSHRDEGFALALRIGGTALTLVFHDAEPEEYGFVAGETVTLTLERKPTP
jgi:hypothetical protein